MVGVLAIFGLGSLANGAKPVAAPVLAGTTSAAAPVVTEGSAQEPSEAYGSSEPSDDTSEPVDTTFKYGESAGFTYDSVEITLKVEAPKRSTNMFDKNNAEVRITVCNKGVEAIDDLYAASLGLYAEDADGGTYDLYGAYRSPEFPLYSSDSKSLRVGKCRKGWVGFSDGKSATAVSFDIDGTAYSWTKSGK
jgi:hypothetical protein